MSFLVACLMLPALSEGLTIGEVAKHIDYQNKGIERIEARADLSIGLVFGILPYRERLDGSYIFRSPDRHELSFPTAPSYLRSLPKALRWDLPASEKYEGKLKGPVLYKGMSCYELLYHSRSVDSKVLMISVLVDDGRWKIRRHLTQYKDGGRVDLDFNYKNSKGYLLLEGVEGEVDLRSYRIKGKASIKLLEHKIFWRA